MPKKSVSDPVFDTSRNRWKVTIPASMAPDNKRVRSWHATRAAGRKYIDNLTRPDEPAAVIAPALAMKASEASDILKAWNLDLVQAARDHSAALEALGDTGSLLEAAKAFRATHDARAVSKPLGKAVALYLDSRADLRDSTLKSYKYTLEKCLVPIHEKTMADIRTADLEPILAPKAATARAMHRRNLRVFWKWASMSPRKWATMETVDALEAIRQSNDSDIAILSPGDVKALMHAAEAEGVAAAAAYAIAIFGGVRMAELARLTWGAVGDDNIEIGKSVAKKHSRRLIPICPTLHAWIDATRRNASKESLIVPPNWVDVSKSVRRRAGWNVVARLLDDEIAAGRLKPLPKATRSSWPANACRHTCASVQVAIGTPLEELTFKFGHSGGHDLLRRHYVSRLTKKDALAILSIGPKGSEIANISAAKKHSSARTANRKPRKSVNEGTASHQIARRAQTA